jgi:uncharacterized protein (TIGR04255 family)
VHFWARAGYSPIWLRSDGIVVVMDTARQFEVIPVPLAEAVIEVRFPGEADVERLRGEFQRAVRRGYPDLLVPRVAVGESVATSPYVFATPDRSQAVLLSINLLGYVVRAYPGWSAFRREFLEHWERLTGLAEVQRANRVALRYTNRFEGPLADAVRRENPPSFLAPLSADTLRHEGSTRMRTRRGHTAHVQVRWDAADDSGLVLDLDVVRDGLEDLSAMAGILDALHADVEDLFLASVESEYAASLGGAPEEAT